MASADGEAPELLGTNNAFHYVRSIRFEFRTPPQIVDGTRAWFSELGRRSCLRLELVVPASMKPDGAAFAGGGDWFIRSCLPDDSEEWHARVSLDPTDEAKPWALRYVSEPARREQIPRPRVAEAADGLRTALAEAERLSRRERLSFVAQFVRARRVLDPRPPPPPGRFADLVPAGDFRSEPGRLLLAGMRAWVFGGMGSWNDVWLEDDELERDFSRVTAELWRAVLTAIVAGTNQLGVDEIPRNG